MENTQTIERPPFEREQRRYNDVVTWLSEVLDGNMRTTFEYNFDGHEIYSQDGSALSPIFNEAVKDAENLANEKPNLAFELRRRLIEKEELEDVFAMARDETPNTLIVVSDFPPELMEASEDVGGYNIARKQTMLRVITKNSDGKIKMVSQTLEGSNRAALEAIFEHFGFAPEDGELLGQRMKIELDGTEQEFLVDELVGVYDRKLASQFGGAWRAGWNIPAERAYANTYDFVITQEDLLDSYLSNKSDNQIFYGLAAAMNNRFEKFLRGDLNNSRPASLFTPRELPTPEAEMLFYAREASLSGKVFSGCGISLGSNPQKMSGEQGLKEQGYGNKLDQKDDYKFDKKMYCVVCQTPPKKEETKKMCGPCGICRTCDNKLKTKSS